MLPETEEKQSFGVGHISLGYILAKATAKLTKTEINLPLIFTLSIIPDADILFRFFISHRGPTHSIIAEFIAFIPLFLLYRRKALPYFVALISHPLIGDFIAGGNLQLFWPITRTTYGLSIDITSNTNIALEITLFIVAIILMAKTRDLTKLFKPHKSNLLLVIPTFTVLLPAIAGFPLQVPLLLLIPHLIFTLMFLISAASILRRKEPNERNG